VMPRLAARWRSPSKPSRHGREEFGQPGHVYGAEGLVDEELLTKS
jgi:hypothetical protein